jgi:hypothetical protein
MRRIIAGIVVFVACALSVAPASAEDIWQRFDIAREELMRADQGDRFTLAADRCTNAIEMHNSRWMVVWCDIASEAANRQRTRERRREFSEPERSLLWQAAWLQAMEGVQADGFFSQPLVERVNISDDITVRRFIAYRLLSSLRSRDYRDVERVVRDLGRLDGVTISSEETLLVGRRACSTRCRRRLHPTRSGRSRRWR